MRKPNAPETLKAELDRCVKCGMCLPECPTYRLTASENESPRGRLALIDGLVKGRLADDEPLVRHLDNCLTCRRCERVCPSQVRYGYLMDEARHILGRRESRGYQALIRNVPLLTWAVRIGQAIPGVLSRPFGRLHRMHRLAHALPHVQAAPSPGVYPATHHQGRGHVGLFPGCATSAQQGGALHGALRLLRQAGFSVSIPHGASCCGALAQHAGNLEGATELAAANRAAFDRRLDAVVSIASGCGIQLDGYQPALPARHYDILHHLSEFGGFRSADFEPFPRKVLLHVPCSVENVYRGAHRAREMLALIPELEITEVGSPGQCCGAAGDYMLRHPDTAAQLRRPIIERTPDDAPQILLTSNIGCAIHLADGLRDRRHAVEVLHPIELLARQLR